MTMKSANQITSEKIREMLADVCGRKIRRESSLADCDRLLPLAGLGLATAAIWLSCSAGCLYAQTIYTSAQEPMQAASLINSVDHTMTLVKKVEVYEFEDLKVSVDEYKVNPGDSLLKILQRRGLIRSGAEQTQMVQLFRDMNPDLENINALMPGMVINVPLKLSPQQLAELELMESAPEPADDETAQNQPLDSQPKLVTEILKKYQRPTNSQQPAEVRILRNRPSESLALAQNALGAQNLTTTDAGQLQTSPADPDASSDLALSQAIIQPPVIIGGELAARAGSGNGASSTAVTDYLSGNAGELSMDASSGVVYRAVKVRQGDTLEKLLRREGMHRDLIYGHLLKVTLRLNPDIKNQDLILAGAEIRIPAAGNYLTAMAGVDPEEVRSAAAAVAERRRPQGGGAGGGANRLASSSSGAARSAAKTTTAAVASLPDENSESAKNTLSLLFTRLGEKVDSRGQAILRNELGGGVELNTSAFPVVQLRNGIRLALDPGSRLSQATVRELRDQRPPIQVFKTGKTESLDRALGKLWPLCGFYRVFNNERTYEGGGDIKLKINADWMIWPTEEAWAAGQPLVINRVSRPDRRTDAAWTGFLEDHGIKLIDIHKNLILPPPEAKAIDEKAELTFINLSNNNPSLFAAELVKNLGVDPKVGVQIDLVHKPGEPVPPNLTAPVLWETDKLKVVLEFGELPQDAIQTLRQRGYRVISAQKDFESVIKGVLDGYGLKAQDSLIVTAPAGGPKMSLTVKGQVISSSGRKFIITRASLPSGLAGLLEPEGLTVLKY